MMSNAITSRDVMAGTHQLRLFESGSRDAVPVLWLHGSGPGVTALANWEGLMHDLAPEFYNVAPDILGFGGSSCPDPFPRGIAASAEFRARNIIDLLDALGLAKVHVIGNSMGGMIALRLAQIEPSRIDRMVLMGAAGRNGGLEPEAAAKSGAFLSNPSVEGMRDLMAMFVYDEQSFGTDLERLAAERLPLAMQPDIARVHAATYDMTQPMLVFTPEDLAAIHHKTLVIHGREDRVLHVEGSYNLAMRMPNADLHVFSHSGHWAQLELRARFGAIIQSFLRDQI